MADEFQVQTRGVGVEVALLNSTVVKGRIFLHELAQHHEGPETVEDVLNSEQMFFPLAVRQGGEKTVLINKEQTLFVRVPVGPGQNASGQEQAPASWAVQVTLDMVQGAPLHGVVHFAQPPGRDRTLDGLNESSSYICLVQDMAFCYVRRQSMVLVRERSPHFASVVPPAPTSTRL